MRSRVNRDYSQISALFIVLLFSFILTQTGFASDVFNEKDLLKLKSVTSAKIGPNGGWIAYTVSVPRKAADKPGSGYSELYLIPQKPRRFVRILPVKSGWGLSPGVRTARQLVF